MEKCAKSDNVVLLFDSYSPDSQNLHESFLLAGYDCLAIVLAENYFLPKGVMSVYELLSNDAGMEEEKSVKPRFFNEIAVPNDWSISTEYEKTGKISYLHEEKGKIYYAEPARKHLVKAVDWYDRKGTVRFRDDYNRYGEICARTVFDAVGQPVNKSWLSANGQELLVKNCVTGDMILNDDGRVKCFRTKIDLLLYLFTMAGLEQSRIFINSLSTPFLISNRLPASIKSDILFWQESIGEAILENMQSILNGQANRIDKVVVQRKSSYNRLLELGAKKDRVCALGLIHSFKKENENRLEALICTNSERIEHCEELVRVLPQMHFHIAAITQMSPNLMRLEAYDNVTLYPNVRGDVLDKLFELCDYYFDINHYTEIVSAVRRAFLNNHMIFAFQETVHSREYVADEYIYPAGDFDRMVSDIRVTMEDAELSELHLHRQHEAAMSESKEAYRKTID